MSSKLVCGWGINDNPVGESRKWIDGVNKRYSCPLTRCWSNALIRCYDISYKERNPTYERSYMSEDWKYLSDFKEWAASTYKDGLVLDKDILVQGNKVYSPETCVFIPQYVNTSLIKPEPKISKGFPIGVNERKGKYISQISYDGKKLHLGVFQTPELAHKAWQQAKVVHLESTICRYASEDCFNSKLADSLMTRVWNLRLQISKGEETTFL